MHIVRDITVNNNSKNIENIKKVEPQINPVLNNYCYNDKFLNFILTSKINLFENTLFGFVKNIKREELLENANFLFLEIDKHKKSSFDNFLNKIYHEIPEIYYEKNINSCQLKKYSNKEEKMQNIFYEQNRFENLQINNPQIADMPLKEKNINTVLLKELNDTKIYPFCNKQEFQKEIKNNLNEACKNQLLRDDKDPVGPQYFSKINDANLRITKYNDSNDDSFYKKIHNYYKNFGFKNNLKTNNFLEHEKTINNENNNEFKEFCHLNNNLNFKNFNYENLNLNKFNNCVFYGDFGKLYENNINSNQQLINSKNNNNISTYENDTRRSILNNNVFQHNDFKKDSLNESIQGNLNKNESLIPLKNSIEEEKFLGKKTDRENYKTQNKALFHTNNINNQFYLQKEEFKNKIADSYLNKKTLKNNKFVYIIKNNRFFKKAFSNCNTKIMKKYSEIVSNREYYDNINCKESMSSDLVDIQFPQENKEDSNDTITAKSKRGSKFRGVSKNGNQWQVLIMINKKKMYIGSFATEEEAAKNYDYVAIRYHGSKAKTNFLYTEEDINSFLLN